jgi:hypothetical protein
MTVRGGSYARGCTDEEGEYPLEDIREGGISVQCQVMVGEELCLRQSKMERTLGKAKVNADVISSPADCKRVPLHRVRPSHRDKVVEIPRGWFDMGSEDEDDEKADFVVSADDGVELALPGEARQVATVLLDGLELRFRGLVGDPLTAAKVLQDGENGFSGNAEVAEATASRRLFREAIGARTKKRGEGRKIGPFRAFLKGRIIA